MDKLYSIPRGIDTRGSSLIACVVKRISEYVMGAMNRVEKSRAFALLWLLCVVDAQNSTTKSGYDYVDPLIGTTNGGMLRLTTSSGI